MRLIKQNGLSMVTLIILTAIFFLIIGGSFLLLNNEKAKTRDAKRLADMARLQAAFELLFNETASYQAASQNGCGQVGAVVSSCNLSKFIPAINQMADPGKSSYTVSQVPSEEGYEVTFYLEKSYGALTAGKHALSPQGIK